MDFKEIEQIIIEGSYLTAKQAAFYLGLTVKTLADYRSKNRKPDYIKRLNSIRYPPDSIIEFIIQRNKSKYSPVYDYLLSTTMKYDIL